MSLGNENARFLNLIDRQISETKGKIQLHSKTEEEYLKAYFSSVQNQKQAFAKESSVMKKENEEILKSLAKTMQNFNSELKELELKKQESYKLSASLKKKMELSDPKFAAYFKTLLLDFQESKLQFDGQDKFLFQKNSGNSAIAKNQEASKFAISEIFASKNTEIYQRPDIRPSNLLQEISETGRVFDQQFEQMSNKHEKTAENKTSKQEFETPNFLEKKIEARSLESAPLEQRPVKISLKNNEGDLFEKRPAFELAAQKKAARAPPLSFQLPSTFQDLKLEDSLKRLPAEPEKLESKPFEPVVVIKQVLPKTTSIAVSESHRHESLNEDSKGQVKKEAISLPSEAKASHFVSYASPFKNSTAEFQDKPKETTQFNLTENQKLSENKAKTSEDPKVEGKVQGGQNLSRHSDSKGISSAWDLSSEKKAKQAEENLGRPAKTESSGFGSFNSIPQQDKAKPSGNQTGKEQAKKQQSFDSDEFDDLF